MLGADGLSTAAAAAKATTIATKCSQVNLISQFALNWQKAKTTVIIITIQSSNARIHIHIQYVNMCCIERILAANCCCRRGEVVAKQFVETYSSAVMTYCPEK